MKKHICFPQAVMAVVKLWDKFSSTSPLYNKILQNTAVPVPVVISSYLNILYVLKQEQLSHIYYLQCCVSLV